MVLNTPVNKWWLDDPLGSKYSHNYCVCRQSRVFLICQNSLHFSVGERWGIHYRPAVLPPSRPTVLYRPTVQSANCPTVQPANHPTVQPANRATVQPANRPTVQPASRQTMQPTVSLFGVFFGAITYLIFILSVHFDKIYLSTESVTWFLCVF